MTVRELVDTLNLSIVSEGDLCRNINGCYIGDLLSWVMSNAQSDNVWLTIMSNINIVAVATLTDVSCIILCENVSPDEECLKKAQLQEINILKTDMSTYDLAVKLGAVL